MGSYTDVKEKALLQKMVVKFQKSTEEKEKKLKDSLDGFSKRATALASIDQNNYKSDVAFWLQVNNVATSALAFIPLAGPAWTALIGPIIKASVAGMINSNEKNLSGALLQGAVYGTLSATTLSYSNAEKQTFNFGTIGFPSLPAKYADGTSPSPQSTYTQGIGSGAINSTVSSLSGYLSSSMANIFKKQMTGKASIPIPAVKDVLKLEVANYAYAIQTGMSWVDDLSKDSRTWGGALIYLYFYTYLASQSAGGRGASLIDSGVGYSPDLKDGVATMLAVEQIANNFKTTAELSIYFHQGSRLISQLQKYDTSSDGGPSTYAKFFMQGGALSNEAKGTISNIALEKARIIAYVDDYTKTLKAFFGNVFIGTVAQELVDSGALPKAFSESGHGYFGNKYVKAVGVTNADRSEHRKDCVIGIYAFHSILQRHLGTYNISGLPAFGMNEELDRRVHHAILDATLTQWWVTSQAYGSIKIGNTITVTDEMFEANLIDIVDSPYVREYFNPERVWAQVGRQLFKDNKSLGLLAQAYSESKTKISKEINDALAGVSDINLENIKANIGKLTQAMKSNLISFSEYVDEGGVRRNLNDRMLVNLMPTKKECIGISRRITTRLSLYNQRIHNYTDDKAYAALEKGWNDAELAFNEIRTTASGYQGNLAAAYKKATGGDDSAADALERQYIALLAKQSSSFTSGSSVFMDAGDGSFKLFSAEEANAMTAKSAAERMVANKEFLGKELAKIHMGAIASADSSSGFDQADFNRSVARAMKLIAENLSLKGLLQ